jgi:adenylate kinase
MPISSRNTKTVEAAAEYAEKNQVFQLFEGLLQQLLVHKPDQPVDFLIKALKNPVNVPKIVLVGPPAAESRTQCELLASKLGVVHVVASEAWRDPCNSETDAGKEAREVVEGGGMPGLPLMLKLLAHKLASEQCSASGWVLEGFPSSSAEAQAMLGAGILPSAFVQLQLSDDVVSKRLTGRRVDPVANKVYHLEDNAPSDAEVASRLVQRSEDTPERVAERIATYRRSMAGVAPLFKKVYLEVDATLPRGSVTDAIVGHLNDGPGATGAPRGCPRVLLLGGPGSKSEALAASLAARFGAVLVSALQLVRATAARHNAEGKALAPYLKTAPGLPGPQVLGAACVPDSLIGPLVLARLQEEDVRTRGFVLVGFPANQAQAEWLKEQKVWTRHVVHLQMSNDDATRCLVDARFDPLDGAEYLPGANWPNDPDVLGRLVPHPQQSSGAVSAALSRWEKNSGALLEFYPTVRSEDASRPLRALEERLAPCFGY